MARCSSRFTMRSRGTRTSTIRAWADRRWWSSCRSAERLANGDTISYARGLEIDHYRGLRRVQHGGDWIGYHAAYARFPDQHTSVIIFCNSDGISPTELADKVSDIVLAKRFPGTNVASTPHRESITSAAASSSAIPVSRLVGSYYASTTDEVARIASKGDSLTLGLVGRSLPLAGIRTGDVCRGRTSGLGRVSCRR